MPVASVFRKMLTLGSIVFFSLLYGDTLGGELSIGAFRHSPSGTASYALPLDRHMAYDVQNDLGWDSTTDVMLSVSLEHPLPFVPNVRLDYSPIYYEGSLNVTDFLWGSISLPSGKIATKLKLNIVDATFYYELLDNTLEADAGITLRKINGSLTVDTIAAYQSFSATLSREVVDFDKVIPMLYLKGRINIPQTDLAVMGTLHYLHYDKLTHYDFTVAARYTFAFGVGIEGGYRYATLQAQNDWIDGLTVDVDISGLYAALVWDF